MSYNDGINSVENTTPISTHSHRAQLTMVFVIATCVLLAAMYFTVSVITPYVTREDPQSHPERLVLLQQSREALSAIYSTEQSIQSIVATNDPSTLATSTDPFFALDTAAAQFKTRMETIARNSDLPSIAAAAHEASVNFAQFVSRSHDAIEARRTYFDMTAKKDLQEAAAAASLSTDNVRAARDLADAASDNLRTINTTLSNIDPQQAGAPAMTKIFLSLIPLLGVIAACIFFVRYAMTRMLAKHSTETAANATPVMTAQGDTPKLDPSQGEPKNLGAYANSLEAEILARTNNLEQKIKELDSSNALLKKREQELVLSNERLREMDTAKSEFLSIAAHQLRTPLAAIKWTLSLLIDENTENLTPEQKSLLMKGYESNERIIGLVNEMLVVTRIESGKVELKLAPIHLEDVADSVMLDFSGQAHVRHMHLSREKPPAPSPLVNADPDTMRSVLQNLIENAMRYTPDGGTINVSFSHVGDDVRVAIKDSGIGIPESQKASIFNKFFRADNASKFRTNGSGLGLYVVKNFVEKHGGKIWFESAEGAGTTFYFTIPVLKIVPPTV